MDNLLRLAEASSLVLYKFTEGEEDWTEWVELKDSLKKAMRDLPESPTKDKILQRIKEFESR